MRCQLRLLAACACAFICAPASQGHEVTPTSLTFTHAGDQGTVYVSDVQCPADILLNYNASYRVTALDGLTDITNGRFVIEALTDDPLESSFIDFHIYDSGDGTCGASLLTVPVTLNIVSGGSFTLEGTVRDASGYAVECASVVIRPDLQDAYTIVANTDRHGTYFAPDIPVADFVFVRVWAPGFVDGFDEVMDPLGGETRPLNFELDEIGGVPIVTGTVFRPTNAVEAFQQPLGGVKVVSLDDVGAVFQTVYTCSDGRFQAPVPTTKQALASLTLSAPGFDGQTVSVVPGSDIVVVLVPKFAFPGAIIGTVTNDGAPVEGANAWVTPAGQSTLQHPRLTDISGLFQVGDIGAGEYEVKIQAEGLPPAIRTVTKLRDDELLNVEIDVAASGGGEGGGGCAAGPAKSAAGDLIAMVLVLVVACYARRNINSKMSF